jgi:glycosyltransferase involved in cell wall biosynthesis
VRVLIFHGYLLRGTGSNVYNAELAAALVRLGHEVHLVCQERHADELEFVGAVGDWDTGKLVVRRLREAKCTVYRPDIGGLLPVYVADRYEGVEARPFQDLSEAQLDAYLGANVSAVADVVAYAEPDVALANHLVMGPVIVSRALSGTDIPYAVVVHGSALEYTVKPYPRFLPYAEEGVRRAACVLVGSSPVAHSLWAALEERSLPERTRIGTPGVDIGTFRPRERSSALARLRERAETIAEQTRLERVQKHDQRAVSAFDRDPTATASALAELGGAAESGPLVAFVGKLILAKGIDLLLAAWPLVLDEDPAARLAVVGFGAYREGTERWIEALSSGDLGAVQELADVGRATEDGPATKLAYIQSFLEWLEASDRREGYLAAARLMRERVILTGRLEHEELADVLPLCEAIVVPSTFPEAFGMVAVEGAACGALPISAAHSGLAEVSRTLSRELPEPVEGFTSFPLGSDVVRSIAARITGWLGAPAEARQRARTALVETVAEHYSWEGVAQGVIAAGCGEVDRLELPTKEDES